MDFNDIVNIIPQFLLLFIPGFIAISISNDLKQAYKVDDKRLVILSILYSFIINSVLSFLVFVIKFSFSILFFKTDYASAYNYAISFSKNTILYTVGCLVLSLVAAYILCILPETKLYYKMRKHMEAIGEKPFSTVWHRSMESSKGLWVRVYISDDKVMYTGQLIDFTSNPNDSAREMYLTNYISYNTDSKEQIEDHSNDGNTGVWINVTNAKRIEIFR